MPPPPPPTLDLSCPRGAGHLACGGFPLAARFTGWGHHMESLPRPTWRSAMQMQTGTCLYVYQMSYIAFFFFFFFHQLIVTGIILYDTLVRTMAKQFCDVWEAGDFSSLQGRMRMSCE
ncbi:unnamed protein product [Gadus morhua 'NCC']